MTIRFTALRQSLFSVAAAFAVAAVMVSAASFATTALLLYVDAVTAAVV